MEDVASKGADSVESGGAGSDAGAIRVRDCEGDSGGGDSAETLGPAELPVVELGLLGAGGCEDDGIPRGDARRIAHRQPEAVPTFAEHRGDFVSATSAVLAPTPLPNPISSFLHLTSATERDRTRKE